MVEACDQHGLSRGSTASGDLNPLYRMTPRESMETGSCIFCVVIGGLCSLPFSNPVGPLHGSGNRGP